MSHTLFDLLRELEEASIPYLLARDRSDALRIDLSLVGERIEIDVFEDGHMEVSRFRGSESIEGDETLVRLLIAQNRK
jgi:hypothetical protein